MPAGWRSAADALRDDGAAGQLIRFAIAGGGITAQSASIDVLVAGPIAPFATNALATAVVILVGYRLHSRWSFRTEPGAEATVALRLLIAAGFAFALNSLWIWLAIDRARLPA